MDNKQELNAIYESRIFVESTEAIGIMYEGYKDIPDIILDFLVDVNDAVTKLIKDPDGSKIDLMDKLRKFKEDITIQPKPSEIDIANIKYMQRTLLECEIEMNKVLTKLSGFKNKVSYGGNYVRAVLKKPKVYIKDIDSEKYQIVNANIRAVNLALDWVEKITIDMFNMISQDQNILMIVKRVYADKKIYESTEDDNDEAEDVEYIEEDEVIEESYGFDLQYGQNLLDSIIE